MATLGIEISASTRNVRRLLIRPREFFIAAAKLALSLFAGSPVDAAVALPDIASSLDIKSSPEKRVVALLERTLQRVFSNLLKEKFKSDETLANSAYAASFVGLSEHLTIEIEDDFFRHPENSAVIEAILPDAKRWFTAIGVSPTDMLNMMQRIKLVFARCLHDEWRANPIYYAEITSAIDSPFLDAAKLEDQWARYRTYLRSLVDEQVFDETFSLGQIYIQPRCFIYSKGVSRSSPGDFSGSNPMGMTPDKTLSMLKEELDRWIDRSDGDSAIRTIAGGPGSGKSSFTKIFAADLAERGLKVLVIPLHQVDLDSGISNAIKEYFIDASHFTEDPLSTLDEESKTIVILDGLDEIQMQGKAAQDSAQSFMDDLLRFVYRKNSPQCKLLCLVTGRDLAIQSTEGLMRHEGQIIYLAPYHIKESDRSEYSDPQNLVGLDQRDIWWKRFGDLTGQLINEMPSEMRKGELDEVTSQPLLNYLVALSLREGMKLDASTNVNSVYQYLLRAVFDRGWARNRYHHIREIPFQSFIRLLEEVALSVWHGAGRTTTVAEVSEHCRHSNVSGLLEAFQSGVSTGVSALLLAFYFRQKGVRTTGEKTFEFTHKTFSEYLTSLRIVRLIDHVTVQMDLNRNDPDSGISVQEAHYRWLAICGNTPIDMYLIDFIFREFTLRSEANVSKWQENLITMFEAALRSGWPVHRLEGLKFNEQQLRVRNAEETLLVCLNGCARVTQKISNIAWPNATSFGETLKRLQGQRNGPSNRPIMSCLSYLNLDAQCLDMADFYHAVLENSSLKRTRLNYAILMLANLRNSDLSDSVLQGANMNSINLSGAKITINSLSRSPIGDPKKLNSRLEKARHSKIFESIIVIDEEGERIPDRQILHRLTSSSDRHLISRQARLLHSKKK